MTPEERAQMWADYGQHARELVTAWLASRPYPDVSGQASAELASQLMAELVTGNRSRLIGVMIELIEYFVWLTAHRAGDDPQELWAYLAQHLASREGGGPDA